MPLEMGEELTQEQEEIEQQEDHALSADGAISPASIGTPGSSVSVSMSLPWTVTWTYTENSTKKTLSTSISASSGTPSSDRYFSFLLFPLDFMVSNIALSLPSGTTTTLTGECDYAPGRYFMPSPTLNVSGAYRANYNGGYSDYSNITPKNVRIYIGDVDLGSYAVNSSGQVSGLPSSVYLPNGATSYRMIFSNYYSTSGNVSLPYRDPPYQFQYSVGMVLGDDIYLIPDPSGNGGQSPDYTLILTDISSFLHRIWTDMTKGFSDVLSSMQAGVTSIVNAIAGIDSGATAPPADKSAADQFKQDMQEVTDKIDQAAQQIEQGTNRPDPSQTAQQVDPLQKLDPSDPAYMELRNGFSSVLQSEFMISILLMLFGFAFVSYVLFGKRV